MREPFISPEKEAAAATAREASGREAEVRSIRAYLENLIQNSGLDSARRGDLLAKLNSDLSSNPAALLNPAGLSAVVMAAIKSELSKEKTEQAEDSLNDGMVRDAMVEEAYYAKLSKAAKARIAIRSQKITEKTIDAFAQSYTDQFASVDLRRVQADTIKVAFQSPVVTSANHFINDQRVEIRVAVETEKEKFLALIDKLHQDPKYIDYDDTLKQIAYLKLFSKDSVLLLAKIRDQKIDDLSAFAEWERIKEQDHEALAEAVGPAFTKVYSKIAPGMVALVPLANKHEMTELAIRIQSDHVMYESVIKSAQDLIGGYTSWEKFSPERQKELFSYLYNNTASAASDRICTANICVEVGKGLSIEKNAVAIEQLVKQSASRNIDNIDKALRNVVLSSEIILAVDKNADQKVQVEEVVAYLRENRISLDNIDTNRNGQITSPELTAAMQAAMRAAKEHASVQSH